MNGPVPHTAADALIDGLTEMGVSHLFANFGSDHPPIIEALARRAEQGRNTPRVILCPHESVGLAAAHGHALVSGQAQAVVVHCDVGTQTLGGAVHNVARARVPVFVFAGETSVTLDGERFGARNRPVQYIQDVRDQHAIVRPYVKWSYPMRVSANAKQLAYRALQLASSAPPGPVYLSAPRELLFEPVEPKADESEQWPEVEPAGLGGMMLEALAGAVTGARRPLIVTSYLGRTARGVARLGALAERFEIPVVEASPAYLNLPWDHPCRLNAEPERVVGKADCVLVIDCDVPWVSSLGRPSSEAPVFHIDQDPLKRELPVWHIPAARVARADGAEALEQLLERLAGRLPDPAVLAGRRRWLGELREQSDPIDPSADGSRLDADFLSARLAEIVDDEAIVLDETITSSPFVRRRLRRRRPGTYFQSGGSALGWHGGAAIGAKLADPDRTVVALAGDGSYFFSVPSAVHWVASRYATPFLTVIYNNGGWNATKQNVLKLDPEGAAARADRYWVNLQSGADLPAIATAAGGAFGRTVHGAEALMPALEEGMAAVKAGRSAVIDVRLPPVSSQVV